jgi:hypothetical protein
VRIAETRPLSKTKRWRVVQVVTQSRFRSVPASDLAPDVLDASAEAAGTGGVVAGGAGKVADVKDAAGAHADSQGSSAEGGSPE